MTRVLLLLFASLVFLELPGSFLIEPDEPRYAEIPREMLATGDWVTPRINLQPYFEKPPLFYWANASSFALLGQSPYSARLVSRLSALAVALLLWLAARNGKRERAEGPAGGGGAEEGSLAGLIFLSSLLPFVLARVNVIDGLLTACLTACLLSLRRFALLREEGRAAGRWLLAAALAAAAGTLAKGLVGVVLPGLVFVAWCLLIRRPRRIAEALLSPAPLLFLLLCLPWFLVMEKRNPGFLEFFFVREHFGRFVGGADRLGPFYFFAPILLMGFLPWVILLPVMIRRWRDRPVLRERPDEVFFLLWVGLVFLFFSLSRSKLVPYILPVFPALSVLAARALADRSRRLVPVVSLATAGVFLILIGLQPSRTLPWTAHPLVEAIREHRDPATRLATFRTYLHGLPWELGEAIPMVSWVGELRPAYERNPDHPLFWQEPDFWRRWNGGERLLVVARVRDVPRFARQPARFRELRRVRKHVLLSNAPAP